jgi:hypothetical protein
MSGGVVRGVAYLVIALIAFLTSILTLFVSLGEFHQPPDALTKNSASLKGIISIWEACVLLTDCSTEGGECLVRDMCTRASSLPCHEESSTYIATQAVALFTVVSMVPTIIMGALDALGKMPTLLCLSQKGLMVAKCCGSALLSAVLFILVLNLLYAPRYCERLKLVAIPGFTVGGVAYLVGATFILNVLGCLIAIFVPPDKATPPPARPTKVAADSAGPRDDAPYSPTSPSARTMSAALGARRSAFASDAPSRGGTEMGRRSAAAPTNPTEVG